MKKDKIELRKMLRSNFRVIIFVFLAFALMVIAAYLFVGDILRGRLLDKAEEMISASEANVRAGLSEAEMILLNTCHFVQGMMEQNASKQEILDYLTITTNWMRQRDQGLLGYYGIYGFIHGEFYDSMGLNPGRDYIPQTRPWYQTAVRSGADVGYTTPYIDARTGDTIVSAVQNIIDNDGRIIGILAIDIEISWLAEYVESLAVASGGYGILINQNMTLIAHPDEAYIGLQLHDLGGTYDEIARVLRSGGEVSARRTLGKNGSNDIVFFNSIFNGWYIGIVTPYYQFFRDLYIAAFILIILGFIFSVSLCYILLRLSAAKMRADEESKYKSTFLANMSHEIRTPMNAITGMAELLLRCELPDDALNYALDIKHAGNNLISIINDILDFSKIEAGKLEIIPVNYQLSSLVNDTVNIIRVRLLEKPIQFNTKIDSNIPNNLIGDEVRIRQIFLNLLSNAVKYTDKGQITMTITTNKYDDQQNDKVWLKLSVTDTGIGIKQEDQIKLFNEFVQLDLKKNQHIEGTGLGLAITKRLCTAMGGDILFESEYGRGSTFTVMIPQGIHGDELYIEAERSDGYRSFNAVRFTFPSARILVVDDISVNLRVAKGLLTPYLAEVDTCLSGEEAIELIKNRNYDLVFMDHMMPEMDGIQTVAVIRAWENQSEGKRIPIIALTANAVAGMREMFKKNGFDDFLAKPIDISKMDEILDDWISNDKKKWDDTSTLDNPDSVLNSSETDVHSFVIPGINIKQGIAFTGGTLDNYRKVLAVFCSDVKERLQFLQTLPKKALLPKLQTHVHALKSALATLGAEEISGKAVLLETACKTGDMVFLSENIPVFLKKLTTLVENIYTALDTMAENTQETSGSADSVFDIQLFTQLADALKSRNASEIDRILEEIYEKQLNPDTKQAVEKISAEILMTEYDNALQIIYKLIIMN